MRILFCARRDLTARPAGDTVQILAAARYLRARGHQAAVESPDALPPGFDLVHFWGLTPMETVYAAFRAVRRTGVPAVLTPIYWDLGRYYAAVGSRERLRLWNDQRPLRREVAAGCLRVFVSGEGEAAALAADVGIPVSCTVVRCGVDPARFGPVRGGWAGRAGVLCAARIGPRKNQAALAAQCAELGLPLTLAGPVGNPDYLARCLRHPGVRYAGSLSWPRLAAEYRRCRVHALTGYAETPGLAALEAAGCGCELAVTGEGTAREYFAARAAYCDPRDPAAIAAALERAMAGQNQPALGEEILERFSWERCLAPLLEAYGELL